MSNIDYVVYEDDLDSVRNTRKLADLKCSDEVRGAIEEEYRVSMQHFMSLRCLLKQKGRLG